MKSSSSLRKRKDLLFFAIVLCIAAVACVFAFSYPRNSSAFPRMLCLALFLIAAVSAIDVLRKKPASPAPAEEEKQETANQFSKTSALIFIMTALYILALTKIGFFVSTYLFVFSGMVVLNYRNKPVLFLWPLALSGIIWLIFCEFLNVPTPEGILF